MQGNQYVKQQYMVRNTPPEYTRGRHWATAYHPVWYFIMDMFAVTAYAHGQISRGVKLKTIYHDW